MKKAQKVLRGLRRPENAFCPIKPFCSRVYQGMYRELAREPPTNTTGCGELDGVTTVALACYNIINTTQGNSNIKQTTQKKFKLQTYMKAFIPLDNV